MGRSSQSVTTEDVATIRAGALVPQVGGAMAIRAGAAEGDTRGKENITNDDLRLPRIAIAQRTSPEIEEGNERRIEGLKNGQMFNTLTRESYGSGPITIIPLTMRKHAMEFDSDLKVVDFEVPLGDSRLEFGKNGEKPSATLFYEFVCVVDRDGDLELAIVSMKTTSIRTAQDFATLIRGRKGAAWDGRYTLSSALKNYPKGPVGLFKVLPAGPSSDVAAAYAESMYAVVKEAKIVTDLDAPDDETDSDI